MDAESSIPPATRQSSSNDMHNKDRLGDFFMHKSLCLRFWEHCMSISILFIFHYFCNKYLPFPKSLYYSRNAFILAWQNQAFNNITVRKKWNETKMRTLCIWPRAWFTEEIKQIIWWWNIWCNMTYDQFTLVVVTDCSRLGKIYTPKTEGLFW